MLKHVYPFLRIVFAFAIFASPALAADDSLKLAAFGQADFMAQVKTAIAKKDEGWLAEHAYFPMLWTKDAKVIRVKSRDQFADRFEKILTPELQAAVAGADPAKAFSNWQGTMLGNGGRNIWFRKMGDDFRIVTINDDSRVDPNAKPQ